MEQDIAHDRPDFRLAAGTVLAKLASRKLKRKLRPVFETVVERTAIPMRCDGAALEFALDRGLIDDGGRLQPINEIEIEIEQGDPSTSATAGEAFSAIGLSCLRQVLSNQEAVTNGEAEGIHQMRVGLRRLRAAPRHRRRAQAG